MQTITIDTNDAGRRVDRFMSRFFPTMPKSMIYKSLRKNCVKVNGKHVSDSYVLAAGDVVNFYIKDEFFQAQPTTHAFLSAEPALDILYQDENIMLINKPVGLMVHDDISNSADTLINRLKHYLYLSGEYMPDAQSTFAPALCNRIDRNTAGIVIAAKNAEALRAMNHKIKHREIEKHYLCMVHGRISPPSGELAAYLTKDGDANTVRISAEPQDGAKHIITRYKMVAEKGGNTLLEIELVTGRSHQIRAHMAYVGHPLVGDRKYGNSRGESGRQMLCAYKLRFSEDCEKSCLDYLSGKEFALEDVWFA